MKIGHHQYTWFYSNNFVFWLFISIGILTPKVELDRETQSHHHVVVSAVDGGGLSCDVDIYIELSDVNDNAPEFVDLPEKFGLLESATVNTLLLRITAEDRDLGKGTQHRIKGTKGWL